LFGSLADTDRGNVPESWAGGNDRHWTFMTSQRVHITQSVHDGHMQKIRVCNKSVHYGCTCTCTCIHMDLIHVVCVVYLLVSQMMAVLSTLPVTRILNGLQAARHCTAPL